MSKSAKPLGLTDIQLHESLRNSVSSLMSDITTDKNLYGPMSTKALNYSKYESLYDDDFDNMSWKGYIEDMKRNYETRNSWKEDKTQIHFVDVDLNSCCQPTPKLVASKEKPAGGRHVFEKLFSQSTLSTLKEELTNPTGAEEDVFVRKLDSLNESVTSSFFHEKFKPFFNRKASMPPSVICDQENTIREEENIDKEAENDEEDAKYTRMLEEEVIRLKVESAQVKAQLEEVSSRATGHLDSKDVYTRNLEEEMVSLKIELAHAREQVDQCKLSITKGNAEREMLQSIVLSLLQQNKELNDENAQLKGARMDSIAEDYQESNWMKEDCTANNDNTEFSASELISDDDLNRNSRKLPAHQINQIRALVSQPKCIEDYHQTTINNTTSSLNSADIEINDDSSCCSRNRGNAIYMRSRGSSETTHVA